MNWEIAVITEVSKTERYLMTSLVCAIYDPNELISETEMDSQTQRTDSGLPGQWKAGAVTGRWGRGGAGVWDEQIQTIM